MDEKVKVIFEGQEEILDTIRNDSDIVKLLGLPTEKCALIGTSIKLVNRIGKGNQGSVFLIEFPGMGEKLYVAKLAPLVLQTLKGKQQHIIDALELSGLDWDKIREWQPEPIIDAWEAATSYDKLKVVIPPSVCRTEKPKLYGAIPNNTNVGRVLSIPEGSYVCPDQAFSELILAIYAGTLYRNVMKNSDPRMRGSDASPIVAKGSFAYCINFFNTYSMFTCLNPKQPEPAFMQYTQYTFMDKIDGELRKYASCITFDKYPNKDESVSDGIYVQTLFAIAAYQQVYEISHNDLHIANLFVEFVTNKTMYGGETLIDKDYYHYIIGDNDIYLPATPVIAKIGDYGQSVKYTDPIVGPRDVIENGGDYLDGNGPWFPNVYMPQYDSLYFSVAYIIDLFVGSRNYDFTTPDISAANKLVGECIRFMCNINSNKPDVSIAYLQQNNYVKFGSYRPVLDTLVKLKTAHDVLLGPILRKYGKKPTSGTIITLGKI